jgi:futalosine hydrolase
MNPDFLILCATRLEISHFLTLCLKDSKRLTKIGLTILSGKICDKTYDLLITGPGVFNAAHALTAYLEQSSPGLIIQAGIAGGFEQTKLGIGDVAIATKEHYIHTGIQTNDFENNPLPFDLIDGKKETRKGIYAFDQKVVDKYYELLSPALLKNQVRLAKGPFVTVSSITSSIEQASQMHSAFSFVMESMEGAASAHIAALYKVPIIEIRTASNFVGQRDKSKWDIDLAAKNLGLALSLIYTQKA